jgi:hypothetical protein
MVDRRRKCLKCRISWEADGDVDDELSGIGRRRPEAGQRREGQAEREGQAGRGAKKMIATPAATMAAPIQS